MSTLSLAAILLCLASAFGFFNYQVLRFPTEIGTMVVALAASLCIVVINQLFPEFNLRGWSRNLLGTEKLPETLLNGALSLLLFAGALHVDLAALWHRKFTVLLLATVGVALATGLFATGMWLIFPLVGFAVPFVWCVVLGSLLAPTDPVAVAAMLGRVGLPDKLQATMAGESLFNDGVGVVVFTTAATVALGGGEVGVSHVVIDFLREAVGGLALGLATGWLAYLMMRRVDEYRLEVMISLALATSTYALAGALGTSGPIATVTAGLIIGGHATRYAMSETTQARLVDFWSLLDELLNAVLFLLIGFELLTLDVRWPFVYAALLALPLALVVRAISVVAPTYWLHLRTPKKWSAAAILTWGGLRGGISVALALSLPATVWRAPVLCVCYAVVVFTTVVQGLTIERLINRVYRPEPAEAQP